MLLADTLDRFVRRASRAIHRSAPGFVLDDRSQLKRSRRGCVTHRYATFTSGEKRLVVTAWRVNSAADPYWVPNERRFVRLDDSTLVSRGRHITVVLAVARDGTTARVTAYGAGAADMLSGWPTTTAAPPPTTEPGLAEATADDLIPAARSVLAFVLDER
jgi:hypothetical protein